MEYESHEFLKYLVSPMKNLVFQLNTLVFRSKILFTFTVWNVSKYGPEKTPYLDIFSRSDYVDVVKAYSK